VSNQPKAKSRKPTPVPQALPEWFIPDWDGSAVGLTVADITTNSFGRPEFSIPADVPDTVLVSGHIKQYHRILILPLEVVMDATLGSYEQFVGYDEDCEDVLIKMDSLRYHTFQRSGCVCVKCGLKGQYFAVERSINRFMQRTTKRFHLNLWGVDSNGVERLFTKDHVIPKSKGGLDVVENLQTMCTVCNLEKGASYSPTL
jgi:hypothetical protein